jgi:hypothetical protein
MNFKDFIRTNNSIIKTLFHIDDNSINIIDDNTRIITKNYRTAKIFLFMPLLKDILEEILKDVSTIKLIITETYDKSKKTFNYEIKLAENKLFENITNLYKFRYYLYLTENNKKINASLKAECNDADNDINPLNKIIIMIMLNYFENEHPSYYKKVVLKDELKPLIEKLSHHSFELNII